jgi:hypothetical protein
VEVVIEFPPSGALVRGEPSVGGKVVVEVVTEVPPTGALVRGEVPALLPPAAVKGGEVFPVQGPFLCSAKRRYFLLQ